MPHPWVSVRGRGRAPVDVAERRISEVPAAAMVALVVAFAAQLGWHHQRANLEAVAQSLPPPPTLEALRMGSAGDPLVMAKTLMLWLQAHDNQPGISIPFRSLDYARVEAWLGHILALDPRGQYPLLAASRVYGAVNDEQRRRSMLELVYRHFFDDPDKRWPWLAHAAIVAKHQFEDLPLALKYARAITERSKGPEVPAWARDMTVVVLEDMGELDAARFLVGGLIHSGRINDPHEIRFLEKKLEELEAKKSTGNR